jgi:hypothetical protein
VACALIVLGAGCQGYSTDFSAPVAIEIVTTQVPPLRVEEFDTLFVRVRVLDRAGDTVAGRPVQLLSLNPDTLAIDSAAMGLVGVRPGTGRVVAISGSLQSAPLVVAVVRAPDSLVAFDSTVDTVKTTDSVSAQLTARLLDLRTDTTQKLGITWGDTVHFAIVYPVFPSLAVATATLGNDSLTAAIVTTTFAPAGTASVVVRRQGSPQPDSVVVQASAKRANGSAVRGSPIRFVVHFQ